MPAYKAIREEPICGMAVAGVRADECEGRGVLKIERWDVPAQLARHIGGVMRVSGSDAPPEDLILPDVNAADLALHFGDPGEIVHGGEARAQPRRIVVGAQAQAIKIRHGAHIDSVFISLPPGCGCLLERSAAQLCGVIAALDALAPALDAALDAWAGDAAELMAILAAHLRPQCDPLVHRVSIELCDADARSVTELAEAHGVSRRQLDRRFVSAVGRTPREFRRIARFARAWRIADHAPVESWTAVAADAGYFDQAHLNHDFQKLARETPRAVFTDAWYEAFEEARDR